MRPGVALISLMIGGIFLLAVIGMPAFGDPKSLPHTHISPAYNEEKMVENVGVSNAVTALIVSYRGYDTIGELTTIFTAGIGVVMLLRRRR